MRRSTKVVAGGGVAATAVAAMAVGAGAVSANRYRKRRRTTAAPWGPLGLQLPPGEQLIVTTADGVDLAVTVAGPSSGPTVVLAHCWTGSQAVWGAVARRLVRGGHRVVLYDHRAHGASTAGPLPPTIAQLGADLRAVLEQLELTGVVLVGHSMGGMAVQSFVIDHPDVAAERVRALVLSSTAPRVVGRAILPASVVELALGDGRLERLLSGRTGRLIARPALGLHVRRAHVEATREGLAATSGAGRAGFLAAMATMDLRAGLTSIRIPTTVISGSFDLLIPEPLARSLAARIPGADLVILPRAGHMLPLEAPDRLVDVIRAHTVRCERRSAA